MKKTLLLMAALLTMGVASVSAKKLNADLSKLSNGPVSTWDATTQTMTWTATSNNMISNFDFPSGNYSSYETITVDFSDLTNAVGIRVQIKANGQEKVVALNGVGTHTKKLIDDFGFTAGDLVKVEWVRVLGSAWQNNETNTIDADHPASAKLNAVYMEGPDVVYIEASKVYMAPEGTTDIKNLVSTTEDHNYTGTEWTSTITYPKELAVQGAAFGNGNGDLDANNNKYVDISEYDFLSLVVTDAQSTSVALRVWVYDDVNNKVVTLYAYPEAECASVTNWEKEHRITTTGTYVVKVSDYKYLKGVKAANNWGAPSVSVSMAYMSAGNTPTPYKDTAKYTLAGVATGSVTLTAALADASAKIYDATGVTGTDVELTPANPNAIFVANEGALANTSNVCVDGTIASLMLQDGYAFAYPAEATALNAMFNRTMTTTYGTMCLPYAFNAANLPVTIYEMGELSADGKTLTLVELEDEVAAGTPVIIYNENSGAFRIPAEGATAALTLAEAQATTPTTQGLKLVGTYDNEVIEVDDAANYYAISNDRFVQAEETITLGAFRAYFTAPVSAGAKIRFSTDGETAINALTGQGDVTIEGVYSVNGAQQPALQKGLNIVKLSNGKTQKILVK